MIDLKEQAAAKVAAAVCSLVRAQGAEVSHGSRNESSYRSQPAIGIRVCAKQTLANDLFNERERFLSLSRFGFSDFGTKLYGSQLVPLSFNTRLSLF
jgi:hypothetical protein